MHHWKVKMLWWTCQTLVSKNLLVEHNKRDNLAFDYVTSLNCDLALAAKYPSNILDLYLNTVREFPSNGHITLYITYHAIWKRNGFEKAALKLAGAKEHLNVIVFQGEFKDNSLHCFFKRTFSHSILNSMILTELGLQMNVLELE